MVCRLTSSVGLEASKLLATSMSRSIGFGHRDDAAVALSAHGLLRLASPVAYGE